VAWRRRPRNGGTSRPLVNAPATATDDDVPRAPESSGTPPADLWEVDDAAGAESGATVAQAMRGLFGRDSVYLITWVVQLVAAAVVTPFVTRLLGPTEFGAVAAATAVMQVLFVLTGCGLQVAVQRWFAEEDGPVTAARLLTLSMLISAVVTLLALVTGSLWSPVLGFPAWDPPLRAAVLWAGTSTVTAAGLALLRSHDKLLAFALVSLLQSVVSEALSLTLVVTVRDSAGSYLVGHLMAQAVALLVALAWVRPRWLRWRDLTLVRAALRFGLPLVPAALGAFVLNSADRLMVQSALGQEAVARYQVAYNIGSLPMLVLSALTTVWLPRFFAVRNDDDRRAVVVSSRTALQRLLAPVIVGMAVASPAVLRLWAPPQFQPFHLTLVTTIIVVTAVPFTALQSVTRDLLTRSGTTAVAVTTIAAAAVNIGLNVVLIPALGINGAALATLLAYSAQHGMLVLAARQDSPSSSGGGWQPMAWLAGAVVLAFAALLLPTNPAGLVLRLVLGLGCLAWFGGVFRRIAAP
jgi:O-antigen/teichoic acid export membrane protein